MAVIILLETTNNLWPVLEFDALSRKRQVGSAFATNGNVVFVVGQ